MSQYSRNIHYSRKIFFTSCEILEFKYELMSVGPINLISIALSYVSQKHYQIAQHHTGQANNFGI